VYKNVELNFSQAHTYSVALMNYPKEIIMASILAVSLAAGLGTITYGFFSENPPTPRPLRAINVFTPQGGLGNDTSGGNYEPYDTVPVYAYVSEGGNPVNATTVNFNITKPDGTQKTFTSQTNDSGFAVTYLSFLPSESHLTGTWKVSATNTQDNQATEEHITVQCQPINGHIDVSSTKNGVASDSFLPQEEVFLEAHLSYKGAPLAATPVFFEIETPNDTLLTQTPQNATTDNTGTADTTFQIPWPSDTSLGTWKITASSTIFDEPVNATTNLTCNLLPATIDVYTQKAGEGPNTPGGTFTPNETVTLYAQIRDALNESVPNMLIGFEVKQFNGTIHYAREETTDDTGTVNITQPISPDPANLGIYEVYVTVQYGPTILIDTLTFIAQTT
jgi:hypothetical protein